MNTEITFNELEPIIKGDLKVNIPVALFSRPGVGKSSFLKDIAKTIDTEVFTIAINQIADRADLTGVRLVDMVDGSGRKYYQQEAFPHATLMEAINYAEDNPEKIAIVFLDEFNRSSPDVTTATMSFTTERKIGTVEFPDNIRFVLAGNLNGNVVTFDDATATRFTNYNVRPDAVTFLDVNPDLNAFIKDMIVDNPGYLTGEAERTKSNSTPNPYMPDTSTEDDGDDDMFDPFTEDEGITQERTIPRTLSMMSDWLNAMNIDKSGSAEEEQALHEILQEVEYSSHANNKPTLLQVSVEGKIGQTDTSLELVDRIVEYYKEIQKRATATATNGSQNVTQEYQDILNEIKLTEDMIEEVNQMESYDDIINFVDSMDSDRLENTMVWLTTSDSYQVLTGVVTPDKMLEIVAKSIEDISTRAVRIFHSVVGYPDNVVGRSLDILDEHVVPTNQKVISLVSFAKSLIG